MFLAKRQSSTTSDINLKVSFQQHLIAFSPSQRKPNAGKKICRATLDGCTTPWSWDDPITVH